MSARCQETEVDHGGGVGEDVMVLQSLGAPEREMEITLQPLWMADLQMREPEG